jgi:hypothetical protein
VIHFSALISSFGGGGMKTEVELFVRKCLICQHAIAMRHYPARLLQPLPILAGAWEDITMDFIEKLSKSEGFDAIMVVVDKFSKYAHFFPLKQLFKAHGVAQVILDNVVKLHRLPNSIVSDRDMSHLDLVANPDASEMCVRIKSHTYDDSVYKKMSQLFYLIQVFLKNN